MPVDFEPFYSASPPLFSHFSSFPDYRYAASACGSVSSGHQSVVVPTSSSSKEPSSGRNSDGLAVPMPMNHQDYAPKSLGRSVPLVFPLRPCLIIRTGGETCEGPLSPTEEFGATVVEGPTSPTGRLKKRVMFADDKGLQLEHIRFMTEPSDCPPRWKEDFLEKVVTREPVVEKTDRWEPAFQQPASDYLEFRRRLDTANVCLENVIIRDKERTVLGTVKVRNLAFNKSVFVRVTFDKWSTHSDFSGSYVPSGCEGTSVYDLYDTFSFQFTIPLERGSTSSFEMCVGYRVEGQEFWDNNKGNNYKILHIVCASDEKGRPKFVDAFTAHIDSWTEFASWNHLVNDTPYW